MNTETKVEILESESKQRDISDRRYAMKIVEKIVFGFVALVLTAVIVALIRLVVLR